MRSAGPASATSEQGVRPLSFANSFIDAVVVHEARDHVVEGVVVNLSPEPIVCEGVLPGIVPAWRSTTLRGGRIRHASRVAIVRVRQRMNLGGVVLGGWDWFGNRNRKFSREAPLYISPQDTIGRVDIDPHVFTNERAPERTPRTQAFELKLNLWWAPPETDCSIHNEHPFLELHTQVHGIGRMQKFRERDALSLYEDVAMAPGMTHEPFARVGAGGGWEYPWHRYYADTDCVWLAIELHPIERSGPATA